MICKYCGTEHPEREIGNSWYCVSRMEVQLEEKDAEITALKKRVRELGEEIELFEAMKEGVTDRVSRLETENTVLREALQEALDDGGHAAHCCARKGPRDEGWIEEQYCSCWNKKAREALGQKETP